jgi:hypothetical protein
VKRVTNETNVQSSLTWMGLELLILLLAFPFLITC